MFRRGLTFTGLVVTFIFSLEMTFAGLTLGEVTLYLPVPPVLRRGLTLAGLVVTFTSLEIALAGLILGEA
ncbi:hypothetical protein D1872_172670 [compost metagenome]